MPLESKEVIVWAEFLRALSFPLPLSHADPSCMVLYPHLPLSLTCHLLFLSACLVSLTLLHVSVSLFQFSGRISTSGE